jgi:hypothetical protein
MRKFMEDVPNEGLIRYRHLLNRERVLPTTPKALSEVLVTKNYEFIKPDNFRHGIGRLLGFGILFAEGDEHKVCIILGSVPPIQVASKEEHVADGFYDSANANCSCRHSPIDTSKTCTQRFGPRPEK